MVIDTDKAGMDTMTVRVEHRDKVAEKVINEVKTHCEVTVGVEVLEPGTLPKTEFKAKRIVDRRN